MRLTFILLVITLTNSCNKKMKEKNYIHTVTISSSVESPEPPLQSGKKNSFDSIFEWLTKICKTKAPMTKISFYNIGLMVSNNNYTLFLIGMKETKTDNDVKIEVAFEPDFMYFTLPQKRYNANLTKIIELIKNECSHFIDSEIFRSSFLSKAESIRTDFSGEIWRKLILK